MRVDAALHTMAAFCSRATSSSLFRGLSIGFLLLAAYASIPVVNFGFWGLDLFAKAYDLSLLRYGFIAALAVGTLVLALIWYGLARGLAFASQSFPTYLRLLIWFGFLPSLFGPLYAIWDVDWLPVYLAFVILPVLLGNWALRTRQPVVALSAGGLVLVLIALIAISLSPVHRLARYTDLLRYGCWCCDYKTRAVQELCKLGSPGCRAIRDYVSTKKSSDLWPADYRTILERLPAHPSPEVQDLQHWLEDFARKDVAR